MSQFLIPRLTAQQAGERLQEIEIRLAQGASPSQLPVIQMGDAVPNPTGGSAPTQQILDQWRHGVLDAITLDAGSKSANDMHAIQLGRALAQEISPNPSDVAHDGAWWFLSLMIFPDLVADRWPPKDGKLPADRWVGGKPGRDRNYLKTAWRRWMMFGELLLEAETPLGEDELVNLLERSSVARNHRLIRAAAKQIVGHQGSQRMDFARELMLRLTYQTGPLVLDIWPNDELQGLVEDIARGIDDDAPRGPKRAARVEQAGEVVSEPARVIATPIPSRVLSLDARLPQSPTREVTEVSSRSSQLVAYEEFNGQLEPVDSAEQLELLNGLVAIVQAEGPATGGRIRRAYVTSSGGRRVGSSSRQVLNRALNSAVRRKLLVIDNPMSAAGYTDQVFRTASQEPVVVREPGPRELDEIPANEIAAVLKQVAADLESNDPGVVFREALREWGWRRLGSNVEKRLREVWEQLALRAEQI